MYSLVNPVVGLQQALPVYNYTGTSQGAAVPGTIVSAVDPWWGGGEFIWARANGAIRRQGLVMFLPVFDSTNKKWLVEALEVTNTANLSRYIGVCNGSLADDEYGWFQISGLAPVNSNANVAAGSSMGIAAAGQAGANSAGKQIVGAVSVANGATTVAKSGCTANSGVNILNTPNADGWFPGAYLSGTGIAAGTLITGILPNGKGVLLSANTTALVTGDVTATYNNAAIFYNVMSFNRCFAQGAIT